MRDARAARRGNYLPLSVGSCNLHDLSPSMETVFVISSQLLLVEIVFTFCTPIASCLLHISFSQRPIILQPKIS